MVRDRRGGGCTGSRGGGESREGGWVSLLAEAMGLEGDTQDDLWAAAGGAGQMEAPQVEERVKRGRWGPGALRYGWGEEPFNVA